MRDLVATVILVAALVLVLAVVTIGAPASYYCIGAIAGAAVLSRIKKRVSSSGRFAWIGSAYAAYLISWLRNVSAGAALVVVAQIVFFYVDPAPDPDQGLIWERNAEAIVGGLRHVGLGGPILAVALIGLTAVALLLPRTRAVTRALQVRSYLGKTVAVLSFATSFTFLASGAVGEATAKIAERKAPEERDKLRHNGGMALAHVWFQAVLAEQRPPVVLQRLVALKTAAERRSDFGPTSISMQLLSNQLDLRDDGQVSPGDAETAHIEDAAQLTLDDLVQLAEAARQSEMLLEEARKATATAIEEVLSRPDSFGLDAARPPEAVAHWIEPLLGPIADQLAGKVVPWAARTLDAARGQVARCLGSRPPKPHMGGDANSAEHDVEKIDNDETRADVVFLRILLGEGSAEISDDLQTLKAERSRLERHWQERKEVAARQREYERREAERTRAAAE